MIKQQIRTGRRVLDAVSVDDGIAGDDRRDPRSDREPAEIPARPADEQHARRHDQDADHAERRRPGTAHCNHEQQSEHRREAAGDGVDEAQLVAAVGGRRARRSRRARAPLKPRCRGSRQPPRARSVRPAARAPPEPKPLRARSRPRRPARAPARRSRTRGEPRPRAQTPARRAACARPYHRRMHLTEAVLAPLRERYGEPQPLRWEGEVSAEEFTLAGYSPQRRHDVTIFVFDPLERLALIQKPSYPQGVWRPPGGGVRPGERFETRRRARGEGGARDPDRARAVPGQHGGHVPLQPTA